MNKPVANKALASQTIIIEGSVFASEKQSGIAYAVVRFITALAQSGHYTKVVLLLPRGKKYVPESLQTLEHVEFRELWLSQRMMRLLSRLPYTPPLDIFAGRGLYIFPNYFNYNLRKSYSITFIHDVAFLLFPETVAPRNREFLNKHVRRWSSRTNRIFTLSGSSKSEIVEQLGISPERISIVPVPLFRSEFSPRELRRATRDKYNIPERYIVYLGNLEPRKNLAKLIKGFAASRAKEENIALLLIGADGWNNSDIKAAIRAARQKGTIVSLPSKYVEEIDLAGILTHAELLIQPSLHEGFGLAPLQAIACGTPVLVSDLEVMHENLGAIASYLQPSSVADITRAINKQIQEGFPKPEPTEIEKILDKFSPEHFVEIVAKQGL